MKKGCVLEHDGGDGNNLSMNIASPFTITVMDNAFNGYEDESCVVCDNMFQIIKFDDLKITQTGRCSKKLIIKNFNQASIPSPVPFNSSKTDGAIADNISQFISNIDLDTQCGVTCSLRESDCKTEWTKPGIRIGNLPNYPITFSY